MLDLRGQAYDIWYITNRPNMYTSVSAQYQMYFGPFRFGL
uniref:Uncharacterized protein n=1 Tax=Arundo donax TaxID=35708 RepID=A0A0A9G1C1_ARUDO